MKIGIEKDGMDPFGRVLDIVGELLNGWVASHIELKEHTQMLAYECFLLDYCFQVVAFLDVPNSDNDFESVETCDFDDYFLGLHSTGVSNQSI